jgi:hypothetical protein
VSSSDPGEDVAQLGRLEAGPGPRSRHSARGSRRLPGCDPRRAAGSGESTLAVRLAERLGFTRLTPGELLRRGADQGSAIGRRVRDVISKGALVPDDVAEEIVRRRLETMPRDQPPSTPSPARCSRDSRRDPAASCRSPETEVDPLGVIRGFAERVPAARVRKAPSGWAPERARAIHQRAKPPAGVRLVLFAQRGRQPRRA